MATKKSPATRKTVSGPAAGANRRAELRAQQEAAARKARRNIVLIVVAAVVVLAVIVGLIFWGVGRAGNGSANPTPSGAQVMPPDGNSTDLTQAAWITVPSTSPVKDAAVRVDIHFDYQCPWCKLVEDTYAKSLESLAGTGDIVLNLHNRIFLDSGYPNQNSTRAAIAAACVDYADNTKFYAYNNTIFVNQPSNEGDGYSDQQLTVDFPAAIGLSGDALDKFKTCYSGRQTQDWVTNVEQNNVGIVNNNSAPPAFLYGSDSKIYQDPNDPNRAVYYDDPSKGNQVGVTGTPTIFVNGKPLSLGQLFNQADSTSYPTPAIGTDAASVLALLQQVANS
ncbi:MAG: thioredoxin domain-containing protein [Propionibacteriaceae bacterium]|nr:thioredoxin domain-containing protein [Propionibacteriaceae bacterium]